MALSDEDVREILRIIDSSELDELRLETPGLSLHVRRGGAPSDPERTAERGSPVPAAATADASSAPPTPRDPAAAGPADVTSPMLGTFYRSDAPGAPPFVEVGSRIEVGSVVCLIEVMKLMNHVKTEVAGTVTEVCAENGQLVEFDQPLFRIEPATA